MSSEHATQNAIRNALAGLATIFRVNVGTGWTGRAKRITASRMVLDDFRPLTTGLPPGFSDLIGWRRLTIGPEHVGMTIAQVVAIEVKSGTGRASKQQLAFLDAVRRDGGIAIVARSVDDARSAVTSPYTRQETNHDPADRDDP